MIISIIAAILFYFLPISFGLIVYKLWRSSHGYYKPALIPIVGIILQFFIGMIIAILYRLSIIPDIVVFRLVLFCLYVIVIMLGVVIAFTYRKIIIEKFVKERLTLLLCLLITIAVYAIWRLDSPYPSPLNWDIYEHLTFAHKLFDGNFSLRLGAMSDTFTVNSYLPIYHVLLSAPFFIFQKLNYLGYYWFLEGIQLFIILYVTSVIGTFLSQSKIHKYLTIVISGTVFISFVAYTPLFHLPQTLTSLLFVLIFTYLLKAIMDNRMIPIALFFPLTVILVLSHFLVGTVSAFVIGIMYVYLLLKRNYFESSDEKHARLLMKILNTIIIALSIFLILVIVFSTSITFNPFGTPESIHFSFNAKEIFQYMQNWFGYGFILVVPALLVALVSNNATQKLISIISLILLSGIFFPFPYTLKILVIAQFILNVQVAFIVGNIISTLPYKFVKILALLVWTILMFIIFYINQKTVFKEWVKYENIYTHVSPAEYEAAEYVRDNYVFSEELLLVSEPATQYIFEAISGINTQGGMYANIDTRRYVDSTYPSQNPTNIKNNLFQIRDKLIRTEPNKILFVVSGRFFEWQEWDSEDKAVDHVNVWKSYDLNITNNKYLDMLATSGQFKQVYRNKAVAVYEVNR